MTTIRWGIIGCGDVTEVKSGPGFQKADNSTLTAVMRRDRAKAEDYAHRHGVPRAYDDAEALIADSDVDAVYVATPPSAHLGPVLLCAAAGKPVLVEKPMAPTAADARRMVDACRANQVPLFVAYYRRALPRFVTVKEIIDSGRIGTVRVVEVTHLQTPPVEGGAENLPWRLQPEIAGGGIFVDMGCHTLDLLDFLFGPVVAVDSQVANQARLYPAEDAVSLSLRFESGVQGVGNWCFSAWRNQEQTRIVGTKGELLLSLFDEEPLTITTDAGTEVIPAPNPPHVHQPLIQTVVDALNGEGLCPSTGETGLRTNVILDRVLAAYRRSAR